MIQCLICLREFKNKKSLSTHINSAHKLTSKQYYDEFIKKEGEGVCKVCGNSTTFRGLGKGYLQRCSTKCFLLIHSPPNNSGRKQNKKTIEKRIKNTDQLLKERHRKETMINRYGVANYGETTEGRKRTSELFKSKPKPRSEEHQKRIINSKRNNGTLAHSDETKRKISIANSGENNSFKKYLNNGGKIPKNSGGISGYYGDLYFRSSLELSFIHMYTLNNFTILPAENNNYVVPYYLNGVEKSYYPDFYIKELDLIVEIKPKNLLSYKNNKIKFKSASLFFRNYKILTEKEVPYLPKESIDLLISDGKILLDEKSIKKLERYKH
jgi:hypothetical protein